MRLKPRSIIILFIAALAVVPDTMAQENASCDAGVPAVVTMAESLLPQVHPVVEDLVEQPLITVLRDSKNLRGLLLGESLQIPDLSRLPVCDVQLTDEMTPLVPRVRGGNHACSLEAMRAIQGKNIEPGYCAIVALAHADGLSAGLKDQMLRLAFESPIALNKSTTGEGYTLLSLCNRSPDPQPLRIQGRVWNHWSGGQLLTPQLARARILRVDVPMPESQRRDTILGFNMGEHEDLLVRRIFPGYVEKDTSYIRTNRALADLRQSVYPEQLLDLSELKNKKVLDAGCGRGAFVKELRELGIDAVGIDIALDADLKESPYLQQADMTRMPYADSSVDVIYSTYTIFTNMYDGSETSLVEAALREFKRVLKPGGKIRLGAPEYSVVEHRVRVIGGLKVTVHGDSPVPHMEIEKLAEPALVE